MTKVFEMNRRARRPIECDSCGDMIQVGERWVFRRVKTGLGWEDSNICEECAVFGPPSYGVFDLSPFAPDR